MFRRWSLLPLLVLASCLGPVAAARAAVPGVASFTTTQVSPAAVTALAYDLVFDTSVRGLATTDFAVRGSASGWTVRGVSGSGNTYRVVLRGPTTRSGDVQPVLLAGAVTALDDTAPGPAAERAGDSVTLDLDAPAVESFVTDEFSPSTASTLQYTLTFSEPVVGLQASSFTVVGSSSGWRVTGVSGGDDTYQVTLASTERTSGTVYPALRRMLVRDLAGNRGPLNGPVAGTVVTLDRTAPYVSSFLPTRDLSSPLNTTSLSYRLTFTEPVAGLDASDLQVLGSSSGWSVDSVTGSGSSYLVTLVGSSITDGTAYPLLDASGVADLSGNPGASGLVRGASALLDVTAPELLEVGGALGVAGATNAPGLSFPISFSEPVSGLTAARFTVGGTSSGWTIASLAQRSPSSFVVTLSGPQATDGTVDITLDGSGLRDRAGNATGAEDVATSPAVTVDHVNPSVVSFQSREPANSTASELHYDLLFSEPIIGLSASDFRVSDGAGGWRVSEVSGSGSSYLVTLSSSGGTGYGTVYPVLFPGTVTDLAGNGAPLGPRSGSWVLVDRLPPSVAAFAPQGYDPRLAQGQSTLTYRLRFSEAVSDLTVADVTLSGSAAASWAVSDLQPVSGSPTSFDVTLSGSGSGTVQPTLSSLSVQDTAGNRGPTVAKAAVATTVDLEAPVAQALVPVTSSPASSPLITFQLTLSEPVRSMSAARFAIGGSSDGWSVYSITNNLNVYRIVLAGGRAPDGTLSLTLNPGGLFDRAGNEGVGSAITSPLVTVDRTPPTVTSFRPLSSSGRQASYELTFSEPVAAPTPSTFSFGGAYFGWSVSSITGSGAQWAVNLALNGPGSPGYTFSPVIGVNLVRDLAGNAGPRQVAVGAPTQAG